MKQLSKTLQYHTCGPGLYEITADVEALVGDSQIGEGVLTLFNQHTSASLVFGECCGQTVWADAMAELSIGTRVYNLR